METMVYYRSAWLEIIHLKNKPIVYKEHNHVSVYTLGFVMEGSVALQRGQQTLTVCPDSFFVVRPYQLHALLLPEKYDMLSCCVHRDMLARYRPADLCGLLGGVLGRLGLAIGRQVLASAVSELYRQEQLLLQDSAILPGGLWQGAEHNPSLQGMADSASFSKYYYIRRFKRQLGMTPHRFQLQSRVRKAQRLIENGESLSAVAATLGFCDQSHFCKCFKALLGITPLQYKQACRRL